MLPEHDQSDLPHIKIFCSARWFGGVNSSGGDRVYVHRLTPIQSARRCSDSPTHDITPVWRIEKPTDTGGKTANRLPAAVCANRDRKIGGAPSRIDSDPMRDEDLEAGLRVVQTVGRVGSKILEMLNPIRVQSGSHIASRRKIQRPQDAAHGILPAVPGFSSWLRRIVTRAQFWLSCLRVPMRALGRADPGAAFVPIDTQRRLFFLSRCTWFARTGIHVTGRRFGVGILPLPAGNRFRLGWRHPLGLSANVRQRQPVGLCRFVRRQREFCLVYRALMRSGIDDRRNRRCADLDRGCRAQSRQAKSGDPYRPGHSRIPCAFSNRAFSPKASQRETDGSGPSRPNSGGAMAVECET
jgi:hypothetical protein